MSAYDDLKYLVKHGDDGSIVSTLALGFIALCDELGCVRKDTDLAKLVLLQEAADVRRAIHDAAKPKVVD